MKKVVQERKEGGARGAMALATYKRHAMNLYMIQMPLPQLHPSLRELERRNPSLNKCLLVVTTLCLLLLLLIVLIKPHLLLPLLLIKPHLVLTLLLIKPMLLLLVIAQVAMQVDDNPGPVTRSRSVASLVHASPFKTNKRKAVDTRTAKKL